MIGWRRLRVRRGVICTVLVALAAGCGSEGGADSTSKEPRPRIVSSINDGARLSGPVPWSAKPVGVPADDFVTDVVFLVDGEVRWADDTPPYGFQGADWRAGAEFLYPATLGRGAHRLDLKATTARGTHVAMSLAVSVETAVRAPAALTKTWQRQVTARDLRRAGVRGGHLRPGTWQIRFARNGIIHAVGVESQHYSGTAFMLAGHGRLALAGPANDLKFSEEDRFCETPGEAPYRWRTSGPKLTVNAISDAGCPGRDGVISGVWTRK